MEEWSNSETDSIATFLGFAATDLTYEIGEGGKHKYFRSPSPANFDAVSLYLLNCSVLSGQNYDATGSGGGQVALVRSHRTWHPVT